MSFASNFKEVIGVDTELEENKECRADETISLSASSVMAKSRATSKYGQP